MALPLWINGKGICCNMMSAAVLWCHKFTTVSVLSLTLESLTTEKAARPGLNGTSGYFHNWKQIMIQSLFLSLLSN